MLQRQQQRIVRVAPERQRIGARGQATVARHKALVGPIEHGSQVTQPTVALIRQLRVEQGPGVVADGAQAGDASPLRGIELVMDIDHLAALDPMHPPLVETVAARTGTGLGRDHHSQRGCLVRHRPVSTGRQQGDALGQGRLQVALEHGDRYFLVAIALAADAANAELRVLGVPGVDRQVALVALGVPETIGHRAQLQPFGLDRLGP